jgi:hypothetical protein
MKITIDTTKDRPEDIRKAVAFLNSLSLTHSKVESKPRNIFEDPSPSLNMDPPQQTPTQETTQPTESDVGNAFTSLFGNSENSESKLEEKDEEKQEQMEIVPY